MNTISLIKNQMNNGIFLTAFICLTSLQACIKEDTNDLKIWYTTPATGWLKESLPIGNGYMGAVVFGGVEQEQIQISEGSLWEGGPGSHPDYNFGNRPGAWKYLDEIRELIRENKMKEAHALANEQLTGITHPLAGLEYVDPHPLARDLAQYGGNKWGDFGANQTAGDLLVDVAGEGTVTDYYRDLDISKAVVHVRYTQGGVKHQRTCFASYPAQAIFLRFENDNRGGTDYSFRYNGPHVKLGESFNEQTYLYEGRVKNNQLGFQTAFHIMRTDGKVSYEQGKVYIKGAKELCLMATVATEYAPDYPHYRAKGWKEILPAVIAKAKNKTFQQLQKEHIADYQNLFNRVSIDLDKTTSSNEPMNERIAAYRNGAPDYHLEALYFQLARYFLISSSRPGTMPAHLQGKWNQDLEPPWACDYHTNINIQMIYWPAMMTNLAECNLPLVKWTQQLVEPGKVTAREYFNARGWMVHTMNNAFGYTAPGWYLPWGYYPAGAAWMCQHLWEHYDFTQDILFLKEEAYPVMREAALFWKDYLIKDKNGELVSSPSYSPEHGGISGGAFQDHQAAWDLLNNCVKAAEVLGINDDFTRIVTQKRDSICKPKIGRWGQLQEWVEDIDDPDYRYGHINHLFAIYPGNQISVEKTPELAQAVTVSLNARGDSRGGWPSAWRSCIRARLKDGNYAYKSLRPIVRLNNYASERMVFQLDVDMGGCAAMTEMLLQSYAGMIEILPALPDDWKNGSVKGLCARGGFEVDIVWKDGKMKETTIRSKNQTDKTIMVKYGDVEKQYVCKPFETIRFNVE